MREPLVRHQIIEYSPNEPFYAANVYSGHKDDICIKDSHWHEVLEIFYVFHNGFMMTGALSTPSGEFTVSRRCNIARARNPHEKR